MHRLELFYFFFKVRSPRHVGQKETDTVVLPFIETFFLVEAFDGCRRARTADEALLESTGRARGPNWKCSYASLR